MEHIMHSNIIKHLENNYNLSDYQHNFRKERSRESQHVITLQCLADGLNSGYQLYCILLYFSKAFGKVPHRRFIDTYQYLESEETPCSGLRASCKDAHSR
jgi:hypothetical protein